MSTTWVVERTANGRFPYRISIEQDGRPVLAVRAQTAWPGAGGQVFCLRERESDGTEPLEPVERVEVLHLARVGRRLVVTLDRPQRRRCEFLKVDRDRADGSGRVEQIFFRTQEAVRAHRTSARVELRPQAGLDVVVDERERYPWSFPGSRTTRRRLPAGDYALLLDERVAAVVERKSLPDFLGEVHEIRAFHQQMAELGSYAHAAVVVEAQYGDLGRPGRVGRWPPSHLLRVVAELAALHPGVPLVFAGNRKMGNTWAQRWFAAVAAAARQEVPALVRQPLLAFEARPADGGWETRVRVACLEGLPETFDLAALRAACPGVPDGRLRSVLRRLRAEGRLVGEGHGRGARWRRAAPPP